MAEAIDERVAVERVREVGLAPLVLYFLKLGATGFGGPIALAGYMRRDLEEDRGWVTHEEFQDGLAIAQTMPGPLAAQLAMWIGFLRHRVLGATLVGLAFIGPPLAIVIGVAALYVHFEGLSQIRALFYGIGPAAIAIIALAAWKLAKSTDGKDPRLWATSLVLLVLTVATQRELVWLFIAAGLLGSVVYAPRKHVAPTVRLGGILPGPGGHLAAVAVPAASAGTLVTLTLFFFKAALFTFGSGLAIVPFLHQGVVVDHAWLTEREFRDAVAMGIITPGPVVITAAFVGYLVAGPAGALLGAFGVFFPVWVFDVAVGRLFLRHRSHPRARGFVKGATAAAVGAIAGAAIVLGEGAITDATTAAIFVAALVTLYLKKLREPYVIAVAGLAGLLLFGR
jgi:chromate transporter